jgi:HK97 family phage major capsid protein
VNEQQLREGLAYVRSLLTDMHTRAEGRDLTEDEQRSWDEGTAYVERTRRTLARYDEARALAATPGHVERVTPPAAPNVNRGGDPFEAIRRRPDQSDREYRRAVTDGLLRANEGRIEGADNQAHFERLVRRHGSDTAWAAGLLARSRDEYVEGFAKMITGRDAFLTTEERAAIAVGTNTAGGFLVPTHLDPTLIMTNAGSSNNIRQIARVVTLTGGANVWHGVTTAGATASWDGELVEVSDDTPPVASVSIPIYKAQALVQASIEAFEDIPGLTGDVAMILADSRDRLEGAAHATGSGSGQPTGIFTALDANTNVEVISTTAATIGLVDIHGLYRAVPVRWRGRGTWLMNPLYSLAIKALGTAVSASYTTDLTQPVSDRLLGRPMVESDDAPSVQTTTANDNEIAFGDFSNYVVVDKPGSTSIEFIPHMFNTANNLPDGRRAWYMHFRSGADSVNDLAFRLLQDKTSA